MFQKDLSGLHATLVTNLESEDCQRKVTRPTILTCSHIDVQTTLAGKESTVATSTRHREFKDVPRSEREQC